MPLYTEETITAVTLVCFLGMFLIIGAIGLIDYIISSVALQNIANRRQIANSWLAWIPYAREWVLGKIAEDYDNKNGIKRKWGALILGFMLVGMIAYFVIMMAFVVVMIVLAINSEIHGEEAILGTSLIAVIVIYILLIITALVLAVAGYLKIICIFKIFESTVPEKAVKYLILSLLVPFGYSICLFKSRNQGYSNPDPFLQYQYISQNAPSAEASETNEISSEVESHTETDTQESPDENEEI